MLSYTAESTLSTVDVNVSYNYNTYMRTERDILFADVATKEIERAFDEVRPDRSWRPFRDDSGKMHGIQWGWCLQNGHLSSVVTGAADNDETRAFEAAIRAAVDRAVRKTVYLLQKRQRDRTEQLTSKTKGSQVRAAQKGR
jgi:hypothetical protein